MTFKGCLTALVVVLLAFLTVVVIFKLEGSRTDHCGGVTCVIPDSPRPSARTS